VDARLNGTAEYATRQKATFSKAAGYFLRKKRSYEGEARQGMLYDKAAYKRERSPTLQARDSTANLFNFKQFSSALKKQRVYQACREKYFQSHLRENLSDFSHSVSQLLTAARARKLQIYDKERSPTS